jgi:hypothetical protein
MSTAFRLKNGNVIAIVGSNVNGNYLSSSELYNSS